MNRDDHEGREAVKRAIIRATKTVPDHDAENGSWPHDRATAYATSAMKGGLYKGVRAKGNGRDVVKQLVPMFRSALGPLQDDSIRFDALVEDACRQGSAIAAIATDATDGAVDVEWTLSARLDAGIVCITEDASLFEAVAVNGATAFDDDRNVSVVLATWRDEDLVHVHAQALAGGVLGVRGVVIDLDGTVADTEENHTAKHAEDLAYFVTACSSVISDAITTLDEQDRRRAAEENRRSAAQAMQPDATEVDMTVLGRMPEDWERASVAVLAPLLDESSNASLASRTSSNAALEKLRRELAPMLAPDADVSVEGIPAPTPFDAIAMRHAIDDGHVERFVATMKDNARAHATEHRRSSREAEAIEVERLIAQAVGPEGRRSVVIHVANDTMGHMRGTYDAAARQLAAAAAATDDTAFGALEVDDSDEDVDLHVERDLHGVHAVKWRSLHDAAAAAMEPGMKARAGLAMIVLHATDPIGSSVMVLQMMDGRPSMGAWRRLEPIPADGEDDLAWCLRRVVGASISTLRVSEEQVPATTKGRKAPAPEKTVEDGCPVPTTVVEAVGAVETPIVETPTASASPRTAVMKYEPIRTRDVVRSGDRRWLQPASRTMVTVERGAEARSLVDAWFSDLIANTPGDRILTDRATVDGEWLVEWADPMDGRLRAIAATMSEGNEQTLEIVERSERLESHRSIFPSLIARLSARIPTWGPDGRVSPQAGLIHDAASLARFKQLTADTDRLLPVLLFSKDVNNATFVDPDQIARASLGAMHVWTVEGYMIRDLDSSWGSDLVPHRGCARLYRPGFHPNTDNKFQNPLYMATPEGHGHVRNSVTRAIRETLQRFGPSADTALGAALRAAINPIEVRIRTARSQVEALIRSMPKELPILRDAPAAPTAASPVLTATPIQPIGIEPTTPTVPIENGEKPFYEGMRSSDLDGMFDDPEEDYEDERRDEPVQPAPKATRKRSTTVKADEMAAVLTEALRPIMERLERIETMLHSRGA